MTKRTHARLMGLILASLATLASADQITMKDGQVMEGTVAGRSGGMVTIEIGGQQLKIPESNIASIQVTMGDSPAAVPASAAAATPPPPAKPTVLAGTRLMLRMAETLDSSKHKAGHRFTARPTWLPKEWLLQHAAVRLMAS